LEGSEVTMRVRLLQSLVLCFFLAQVGYAQTSAPLRYVESNKTNYLKLADETDTMLRRDLLGVWFPRTIDNENGGFHAEFNREWQPTKSLEKFSVFLYQCSLAEALMSNWNCSIACKTSNRKAGSR
jgi:hypothetical protein